jgi:hypothetical protein
MAGIEFEVVVAHGTPFFGIITIPLSKGMRMLMIGFQGYLQSTDPGIVLRRSLSRI